MFLSTGSLNIQCLSPKTDPCYLFVKTPPLNYDQATLDCQAKGGFLAKIKNAAENTFVFNMVVK